MPELRHAVEQQKATARVLLVADEALGRGAITEALNGAGLCITGVTSADAALSATKAEPEPPAVVLVTDTDLPGAGMDGIALAGKVRRRWPNLGVVFVTARPSRLDGHFLCARDRFLPKPVAPGALLRAVQGLVRTTPQQAASPLPCRW